MNREKFTAWLKQQEFEYSEQVRYADNELDDRYYRGHADAFRAAWKALELSAEGEV